MLLYFLFSWLPVFLINAGWSPSQASHGIALLQFGGIAGSLVQAWLVDRRRTMTALIGGYGTTLISALLFAIPGSTPGVASVLLVLMGSGVAGVVMSIIALGAIFYPPGNPGHRIWLGGRRDAGRRGAGAPGGEAGSSPPGVSSRATLGAGRGARARFASLQPSPCGARWPMRRSGLPAILSVNLTGASAMNLHQDTITTRDGVRIFYKDWGDGPTIVFSHGWPLSADDWDAQLMFFVNHGFRVIAHDRRGHGRSSQTGDGHDMDHYADDLAALTAHLDLREAVHVGHSTGGGEVARYLGRHGQSRVAKAVLISAVPPLMLKTSANPGGLPKEVFDGFQKQVADNRAQFYLDLAAGPFYGFNRPGAKGVRRRGAQLVAAGNDGRHQGASRWHRRLLADGFHAGSVEDHGAHAGDAWR